MKVRCQSCKAQFEVPVRSAGRIDYDGCKNVFRVSYRFRTPCPRCKKILQLTPLGKAEAAGIVVQGVQNETTEAFAISSDATLPREIAVGQGHPIPTVRVAKIQPSPISPAAKTKVQPFRFVNQNLKRPAPLHVAVRPRKKSILPLFKFLLSFVIAGGTAVTIILTILALRTGSTPIPPSDPATTSQIGAPMLNQIPSNEPEPPREPQGGPLESFVPESFSEPPPIVVKPADPMKKRVWMKLPSLDKLTSGFGVRLDPFQNTIAFHSGIDFKAEYRSEVKAALAGRVVRSGPYGSYGNVVFIEHADGYESRYAHLEKVLVKEGKRVKQGELVGLAGSTGRASGTHVHFELLKDGKRVDPLRAKLLSKKG